MMNHKTVEKRLLSFPDTKLDYPFGEDVAVYKVFVPGHVRASGLQGAGEQRTETYKEGTLKEQSHRPPPASTASTGGVPGFARKQDSATDGDWKMFALVREKKEPVQLSLKCDPLLAETLRAKYESVLPGYHLNKKHWNTIVLTGQLSWDEIKDLIRLSYNLVTMNE